MRVLHTFFAFVKKYRKILVGAALLLIAAALVVLAVYLRRSNVAVLNPAGLVGDRQRQLIIVTVLLATIVVVPVFVMTIYISIKYRAKNSHKNTYTPEWDKNKTIETIWWGIPVLLISVLAVITWISTFHLDPYRPIKGEQTPMKIQVVSMDWKWLFIYPEEGIATVNFVQFPVDRQVDFELTSDAPMNSFWIPQLGGQMYTMPGMTTHIYLIANQLGDFAGSSANISGSGFAGMKFTARASSESDYQSWITHAKHSELGLDKETYGQLAKPSKNNPVAYYASVDETLYANIVMKYMMPGHEPAQDTPAETTPEKKMDTDHMNHMQHMEHMETGTY